jgi:hypothetical protein
MIRIINRGNTRQHFIPLHPYFSSLFPRKLYSDLLVFSARRFIIEMNTTLASNLKDAESLLEKQILSNFSTGISKELSSIEFVLINHLPIYKPTCELK